MLGSFMNILFYLQDAINNTVQHLDGGAVGEPLRPEVVAPAPCVIGEPMEGLDFPPPEIDPTPAPPPVIDLPQVIPLPVLPEPQPSSSRPRETAFKGFSTMSRLINFKIEYRDKTIPLVLVDAETVGHIKALLEDEIGVPRDKQVLKGWSRHKVDDGVSYHGAKIKCLHPEKFHLRTLHCLLCLHYAWKWISYSVYSAFVWNGNLMLPSRKQCLNLMFGAVPHESTCSL
jgi:hypothetical protein